MYLKKASSDLVVLLALSYLIITAGIHYADAALIEFQILLIVCQFVVEKTKDSSSGLK